MFVVDKILLGSPLHLSVSDNYRHNLTRQGGRVSLLQNGSSTEGAKLWLDSSIRENIDALRIYKLNLLVPNFSYDPYNVNALKSSDTPFIRNSYLKTLHFKQFFVINRTTIIFIF